MKIMQTRQKASKIQELKDERDRVLANLLQNKKENEMAYQMKIDTAKSEYDNRQARKL